ncbi:O-antigen ligase family protein [Iamia sp. SCSIO 61187]|uniref:O-antigen ligase family protein n=1 Tax=Iamia sp. SCSIO 61187 TaxID=2722752 RepID=UPI001C635D0C|nr:O-antigen ligase family protein [Iamia sp. SCSIO 61187]QYG91651.1 O-antigen ligase family protein [Iamia sp. SCSIO 61187]
MVDRPGATVVAAGVAPAAFLAVDPGGWYPFGPLRWMVVSVGILAAALLVLGRRPQPAAARGPVRAAAVLVAVLAVAAAVGRDPLYAWTGTPERHAGVALWLLCLLALVTGAGSDPVRGPVVVARGLVVAALGVGAVAGAEALGWEPAELDVGSRLTGSFGSSAFLGAAGALLLPAVVGSALDGGTGRRWRWAAGLGGVAIAVALVGSGARSAWLGVAVAGAVALAARREQVRAGLARHPRAAVAGVAAGLVAVAAVALLTPAGARLAALGDDDAPGGRGRLDEWRVATRVIADHPVLGVGPEGYRVAFADGVDVDYEVAHGRDPQPDRAHSAPLDVALSGGVPGLLAWGAWVVLVVRRAWQALRRGPPLVAGLAAAIVAHLAGQLTLFPLAEVEPVAWLLAGLVLAATPDAAATPASEGAPARGSGRPLAAARVVVAALLVVALGAGALDVAADHRAEAAARALARGDGRAAADAADDAVGLRPDVVRLRLLAARAHVAAGDGIVAALAQVDAARRTSPGDPIVRRERVRLLVERAAATEVPEHARRAQEAAEEAVADDPRNGDLWLLVAMAARLTGDERAAEVARRRATALGAG